jgi:hypothetical protein
VGNENFGAELRGDLIRTCAAVCNSQIDEASKSFLNVLEKYIKPDLGFEAASSILREAGFHLTVFGDGYFEEFPDTGVPKRGGKVTGILKLSSHFMSSENISIDIYPIATDDFNKIKSISVRFFAATP